MNVYRNTRRSIQKIVFSVAVYYKNHIKSVGILCGKIEGFNDLIFRGSLKGATSCRGGRLLVCHTARNTKFQLKKEYFVLIFSRFNNNSN
jgi:hypothetical protein